jgi:DNA-binding transcriptional ArsR family regulator
MNDLLKIISSPIRLKIITCLLKKDYNVSNLIKNCGISQSAISQHLKKLKDAKVIKYKKVGKYNVYKLNNKKIGLISKQLTELLK